MPREVVAVLDRMPESSRETIEGIFGGRFDVRFTAGDSEAAQLEVATGATVLLTMWGSVSDRVVRASGGRLIQKLGVGTDKIDTVAAAGCGMHVLKAAGINADAVAEHTVLLMLAVARNLNATLRAGRAGTVQKEELRAQSSQIVGKTVGLLGLGHIGRGVAQRLGGFGVTLIYHDVQRAPADVERQYRLRFVELDELARDAEILSLHLPSTPATERIIDADFLSRVRPGLILVNTARGSLVDESALVDAIQAGRVLGAGLDVNAIEPLPAGSPLVGLDRVVLTPHVAGAVANNFPRVIERAYRNAVAILDGGSVDPADLVAAPVTGSASELDG